MKMKKIIYTPPHSVEFDKIAEQKSESDARDFLQFSLYFLKLYQIFCDRKIKKSQLHKLIIDIESTSERCRTQNVK